MRRMFWCLLFCLLTVLSIANIKHKSGEHIKKNTSSDAVFTEISCTNAPALLDATNATSSSVDLTWASTNSPQESNWEIELVFAGNPFTGTPTHSNITQNSLTLTNLDAGTNYCFRVRGNCGTLVSAWSNTNHCFQTHIVNPSNCGIGFPINDNNCGFGNDYTIVVNGLNGTDLGTDVRLNEVRLLIDHDWEQDLHLQLTAPNGTQLNLARDLGGAQVDPAYGDFSNSTCDNYTTFHNDVDAAYPYTSIQDVSLTTFTGDFFPEDAFSNLDTANPNGNWTLSICDDAMFNVGTLEYVELVFEELYCPEPTNVAFTNATSNSVLVTWTNGSTNVLREIEVVLAGQPFGTGTIYPNAISPFQVNNLEAGVDYELIVRENCGTGFFSPDSNPIAFATECITFPESLVENFDNQNSCNTTCGSTCDIFGTWRNASTNRNNWLVYTSPTPTPNTGPLSDFSGSGNYIYIETSGSACQEEEAILQSNCIAVDANQGDCHFSFQYHMKGYDVQVLHLEILEEGNLTWNNIWSAWGEQGNAWRRANIDLRPFDGQNIQLRFVGLSGAFDTGDIALDELVFYGSTDEGLPSFAHYYDLDQDGFGDAGIAYFSCSTTPPTGYVSNDLDCNDSNNQIHPDIAEVYCNQIDENCNGMADDTEIPVPVLMPTTAICPSDSIDLQIASAANGTFEWYDAPIGGTQLTTGSTYSTPPLLVKDTIYVEDVITVRPGLRITEIVLSFSNSAIEVQNIGPATDYTGWKIVISDDNNEINNPIVVPWNLGQFADNEVQTNDKNNWGASISWLSIWKGWALLVNADNEIEDAVFWNWTASDIAAFDMTFGAGQYTASDLPWLGSGFVIPAFCGQSLSMVGSFEGNSASDYVCSSSSLNTANPNLNLATTCRSQRLPVPIDLFSAMEIATATASLNCDNGFGNITANITGGQAPYNYQWSNGGTGQQLIQVPYGDYWLTVTDANACTVVQSNPVSLLAPAAPFQVALITSHDVSCHGGSDGMLLAELTGGTAPYQYNWSAGFEYDINNTLDSLPNLPQGMYNLTVTDGQGCVEVSNMVSIAEPAPLELQSSQTDIVCHGAGNGAINLTCLGGVSPLHYVWNSGDTTAVLLSLNAGQYIATITDANDCFITSDPIEITEPTSPLQVSILDFEDISCYQAADGLIESTVSGGTTPYTYNWGVNSNNQATINNLSQGSYQLTVIDGNACSVVSETIVLNEADTLMYASPVIENLSCDGMQQGGIELNMDGGIPPYNYQWSNFETTASITNLDVGIYFCTVTDAYNCFYVTDPLLVTSDGINAFSISIENEIQPSCHDSADGMIDISVSGGTPPLTYAWNNGDLTEDLEAIDGGLYRCTITDANGCQEVLSDIELGEPAPLITTSSAVVNDTFAIGTGSISIVVIGGNAPYSYSWSDPMTQNTATCSNLSQGIYTVTVTDLNGCTYEESFYVDGSTAITNISIIEQLDLYPNPTNGLTTLNIELLEAVDIELVVYSVLGQAVTRATYEKRNTLQTSIDLSNQAAGVYFVQLRVGGEQLTERLLLTK